MAHRGPSVRRARRQRTTLVTGFLVTYDVDSKNRGQCSRVRRFLFGQTVERNGKTYRYPGFLEHDGVRYMGQSVIFVTAKDLDGLHRFLLKEEIERVTTPAFLGTPMAS